MKRKERMQKAASEDTLINRFPICRTIGCRQTGQRSYEDDHADA